MKILITGSNGFIAKNFINYINKLNYFSNNHIEILPFTRENTYEDLSRLLKECDLILHLAGEVRPKSSDDEFKSSNYFLTEQIIDILNSFKQKKPIIFSSTIHASDPKNAYGKTKKDAEDLLLQYSSENNIPISILRLPHLYGERCKPNYNSVITTWIDYVLSGRENEIKIFNNVVMHYLYVQDLCHELFLIIEEITSNPDITNTTKVSPYKKVDYVYDITLEEVKKLLLSFKDGNDFDSNSFSRKLYKVFLYYKYYPLYLKIINNGSDMEFNKIKISLIDKQYFSEIKDILCDIFSFIKVEYLLESANQDTDEGIFIIKEDIEGEYDMRIKRMNILLEKLYSDIREFYLDR